MKAKNENVVNEEEIQKTVLDVLDESDKVASDKGDEVVNPLIKLAPAVPGAPNNMIQKHLDNFLAKIAGETPVDDEVRDSTEYWLNKIAESGGGGEVKKYKHNLYTTATGPSPIYLSLVLEQETPITSASELQRVIESLGYISEGTTPLDSLCIPCIGMHASGTSIYWFYAVGCAGGYSDHRLIFKGIKNVSGSFSSTESVIYSSDVQDIVTPL